MHFQIIKTSHQIYFPSIPTLLPIFPNENVSHIPHAYREQTEQFTREVLANLLVGSLCNMLTRGPRLGNAGWEYARSSCTAVNS